MQKVYIKYPELSNLKSNITSRKQAEDTTQIILDRTIFMPKSTYLLADKGNISGMEIISIEEKRDNIIHLVKGRPEKSQVILRLDMDIRYRNLVYNTSLILFKILMTSFYSFSDIKLQLTEDKAQFIVSGFDDLFDEDLVRDQLNLLIAKNIRIDNNQGISSVHPLGEVINNDIAFDNAGKLLGFKIANTSYKGTKLTIDFIAGSDILSI